MKSAEELLIEISAASRITRDGRLLALLGDIKEFLESSPPAQQETQAPYLGPRGGRTLTRDGQLKKNAYMARYMKERRRKQKEAKLAIINSTSSGPSDSHRPDDDTTDIGEEQASQTPPQDSEA